MAKAKQPPVVKSTKSAQAAQDQSPSFEIDDNVEIPATASPQKSSKYPVDKLEVGQSFLIPTAQCKKNTHTLSASFNQRAKKLTENGDDRGMNDNGDPKHFVSRKVKDGVRVWRDA